MTEREQKLGRIQFFENIFGLMKIPHETDQEINDAINFIDNLQLNTKQISKSIDDDNQDEVNAEIGKFYDEIFDKYPKK